MKKILLTITVAACLTTACAPAGHWTKQDVALEAAWEVLHAVDWGQTRNIAMDPEHYYEAGPARIFIGDHPSVEQVDAYMGASAVLHPVITHWLPKTANVLWYEFNPRLVWQSVSIGMSGACVLRNAHIGLHVKY